MLAAAAVQPFPNVIAFIRCFSFFLPFPYLSFVPTVFIPNCPHRWRQSALAHVCLVPFGRIVAMPVDPLSSYPNLKSGKFPVYKRTFTALRYTRKTGNNDIIALWRLTEKHPRI